VGPKWKHGDSPSIQNIEAWIKQSAENINDYQTVVKTFEQDYTDEWIDRINLKFFVGWVGVKRKPTIPSIHKKVGFVSLPTLRLLRQR
jgi:hypothetical protein